ncbi:protein FAR1-RELATED SEQUENCE 5-like [Camellia sinensis]|uniref:protein FAR1-RELATED SEQUENCE 5-like n=1 Tax=Camellia sinensis TaxID=4442 RepID=UPI0010358FC7|nr:protein FAR1-RELATED SEQUENCE 5-like [Camellia sinensis]
MEVENGCAWKPKQGMTFDSKQGAYDFYNAYGGRMRFNIRMDYSKKNKFTNQLICRLLVCSKEGFRKVDKRDPLSKNPRAETRTGYEARLYVKLDECTGKFVVTDFKEKHNHDLLSLECAHMLPSQRKTSATQAIELELAIQSGLYLGQSFELMGREVGDNEEQITNMFWADAQMIMDYAQFGDVVTFDTTYKLNKEHRPFASFVGFNHHRKIVIFGASLLYDETVKSFIFEEFQNEYFRSIESDIEAIEYGEASTIFTVVDVLRDILRMKEVPSQYIAKRWTKQARAETVKDITGNDIQVDVKFQ